MSLSTPTAIESVLLATPSFAACVRDFGRLDARLPDTVLALCAVAYVYGQSDAVKAQMARDKELRAALAVHSEVN